MTTPDPTLVTRTARLELHRASEHTDSAALLEVFNSNPQWIAATNDFAGQTSCDRSDVEMFLWQATMRENGACLEARVAGQKGLVGVVAWITLHPRDRCPWIGCIVLHADHQRRGLGSEVLRAVEQLLAAAGWERVLASPPLAQPSAQAFLQSVGYTPIEERLDQDKRRCMVMEKSLIR
jgi:RimJ/RimL family protein N-acetyltransferase